MANLTRRQLLGGAAALVTLPWLGGQAWAQDTLGKVADDARRLEQLHALVIHRHGEPLFADAFRGPSMTQPANIKSASKTLLALMTGIAIERGVLEGTDQRVLPLLGRPLTGDARDALTIGHLLSMQTGLESTSGANYSAWVASSDWVDYVLTRPLVDEPGGRFIYSTGSWHLLGVILARASGKDLHRLANNWLGSPLGITIPPWVTDPQGYYMGGNEMPVSPLGLAKIGNRVLADRRTQEHQLVSKAWIDTSWQPRGRSRFSGDQYGYGWFLTRFAGQQAAYARGYGGQMLVVVPDQQLSIAITSDPTRPARSGGFFGDLRTLVTRIVALG
ncbi:serine hydrolase domain-containing protein [Halomonas sp. LS-001]